MPNPVALPPTPPVPPPWTSKVSTSIQLLPLPRRYRLMLPARANTGRSKFMTMGAASEAAWPPAAGTLLARAGPGPVLKVTVPPSKVS